MDPVLNFFGHLVEKYIVHIPPEKHEEFKKDFADLAKGLTEAAVKGAAEGLTQGMTKKPSTGIAGDL